MIKRLALAVLAAGLASGSAFADPPLADSLAPNLTLGLQFGGSSLKQPVRFTALFDVRSQLLRRDLGLMRAALGSGQSVDLTTAGAGVSLVTVLEVGATSRGFELANVLGQDMLRSSSQLNEAGETSWWQHKWIWWTAGGVVATGAALASASGHQSSDGSQQIGSSSGNCNVVGAQNIPPQPGDPQPTVLGPDCQGVPKH